MDHFGGGGIIVLAIFADLQVMLNKTKFFTRSRYWPDFPQEVEGVVRQEDLGAREQG